MQLDPDSFFSVTLPLLIAALGFGLMALALSTGRVGQAQIRRDEHPLFYWTLTLLLGAGGLVALLILRWHHYRWLLLPPRRP